MYIYIVRHGQTEWNKQVRLQGRSDIPLNEEGKRMAEHTSAGLTDVAFTRIYSSPLKRAIETAEIIRGSRNISVNIDERIVEMGFGEFEGIEFEKSRLEDYGELNNFFKHPHLYIPPVGGESIKMLRDRTASFMSDILSLNDNEIILVVTHGAAISGLLAFINKADDEHLWGVGVHKNCAVTILEKIDKNVNIIQLNKSYN